MNVLRGILNEHNLFTENVLKYTVRWRRKPRWLPVAKSKQFRIAPRTVIPEEEKRELFRLHCNYNTQIKALRRYLFAQYGPRPKTIDVTKHEQDLQKDFIQSKKINDAWNFEVAAVREKRLALEMQIEQEKALERIITQRETQKQYLESMEELIRTEKENAKFFITSENIDKAIEQALANPVDYNFAINTEGNIIKDLPDSDIIKEKVSHN